MSRNGRNIIGNTQDHFGSTGRHNMGSGGGWEDEGMGNGGGANFSGRNMDQGPREMPDPQYLMMLKMIDPDIDLSELIEKSMGIHKSDKRMDKQMYGQQMGGGGGGGQGQGQYRASGGNKESMEELQKLVANQTELLESISGELVKLKSVQKKENENELKQHVKRLEKMIAKKAQRAEQEEFQYNLKRDMADYVKGLGELFVTKTGGSGGGNPVND
jgi:hypothetical protein